MNAKLQASKSALEASSLENCYFFKKNGLLFRCLLALSLH
jgi:hypothetical protein